MTHAKWLTVNELLKMSPKDINDYNKATWKLLCASSKDGSDKEYNQACSDAFIISARIYEEKIRT